MEEKNNMNSILEAAHGHKQLKREFIDGRVEKNRNSEDMKKYLTTL